MRTRNSIINTLVSTVMSVVTILIGFIPQKVFISIIGTEYLGLNGLFNNILSILSVAELGFGTAIVFNLYRPIAENDTDKINKLLCYYKKIYFYVFICVSILGLIILPFIPYIVGKTSIVNLRFLFLLALIEVSVSYLLTYKRSILYADQKNYIVNIVHIIYVIILNVSQICVLITTKNYILYLLIKIICRILENIVINMYVNKKYKYLQNTSDDLDDLTKDNITSKVKGLLFHNIGAAMVQGTDNILISNMFGIVKVGLYSNYFIITNAINSLITQIFQSITSSVGNLLIEEDSDKIYSIYKNMLFLNAYIYTVASICIMCGISDFIKIWLGDSYLLDFNVLMWIVISFFITGMKKTNSTFKNAAGIFYEDRFVPIFEAIVNIVMSIVFGKLFGLSGIFMGTITSSFFLILYSYPILVYKNLFHKNYFSYFIDNFKYFTLFGVINILNYYLSQYIIFVNPLITFVVKMIVSIINVSLVYLIIFYKSNEVYYYRDILIKSLKNRLIK